MDVNKVPWKAENGCIFVLYPRKVKGEFNTFEVVDSVAFNIGQSTAERIVNLHNEQLKRDKQT